MSNKMSSDEFMDQLEKALRPDASGVDTASDPSASALTAAGAAGAGGAAAKVEMATDSEAGLTRQELVDEFDDPIKNGRMQAEPAPKLEAVEAEPTKEEAVMKKLIAQVQTKHRQLMYRIVAGESEEMICREMGIAQNKFKILTNSPLFKTELDGLRKKLQERLLDKKQLSIQDHLLTLNATALKTLVRILTDTKGVGLQLKRQVAKDIIDYNLKLTESQNKGSYSETAGFIMEAFDRAEKRKSKLERPAHLDMPKDSPFSAPAPELDSEAHADVAAVNE